MTHTWDIRRHDGSQPGARYSNLFSHTPYLRVLALTLVEIKLIYLSLDSLGTGKIKSYRPSDHFSYEGCGLTLEI